MEIQAFLNHLRSRTGYDNQIAHIEHISPRRAIYGELEEPLAPALRDCLEGHGLGPLYAHQTAAVNHARAGKNVIIATSSASGKSLVYNIAVMQAVLTEPGTRALYMFPTNALAPHTLRT